MSFALPAVQFPPLSAAVSCRQRHQHHRHGPGPCRFRAEYPRQSTSSRRHRRGPRDRPTSSRTGSASETAATRRCAGWACDRAPRALRFVGPPVRLQPAAGRRRCLMIGLLRPGQRKTFHATFRLRANVPRIESPTARTWTSLLVPRRQRSCLKTPVIPEPRRPRLAKDATTIRVGTATPSLPGGVESPGPRSLLRDAVGGGRSFGRLRHRQPAWPRVSGRAQRCVTWIGESLVRPRPVAAIGPTTRKARLSGPFLRVAGAGFEPATLGYEPDELPDCSTPRRGPIIASAGGRLRAWLSSEHGWFHSVGSDMFCHVRGGRRLALVTAVVAALVAIAAAPAQAKKVDLQFPDGFLWGTATAGFQTEAGFRAADSDTGSDWWAWTHDDANVQRGNVWGTCPRTSRAGTRSSVATSSSTTGSSRTPTA